MKQTINNNTSHAHTCEDHNHSHSHDCSSHNHAHEHGHEHSHNNMTIDVRKSFPECATCHHSLAYCTCAAPAGAVESKTYTIENLDCANCGAKIERKLKTLPAVKDCSVVFATKQLRLKAAHQNQMMPEITSISQSIEPDVEFIPKDQTKNTTETVNFNIEGLDCANCAAKIEAKINEIPGVENAEISYSTGLLRVTGKNPQKMIASFQKAADSLEEGVKITPRESIKKNSKTTKKEVNTELIQIIIGAAIFALSWIFHSQLSQLGSGFEFILQAIAYLILGGEILINAAKNLLKGNFFDENFLMSIATLAAFAIGEYHEAVGVMLFYRVGEYFEDVAVQKSRNQIMDAVDMRPETVTLVNGDATITIPAEQAEVNDIVLIRPGDRVPLDGTVVEGESRIDTSPVTGEPVPVHVEAGDEVVSGTVNTNGLLKIKVEKPLSQSMVTRILESVENAAANKPKMDRFITRFSRVYTPVVVLLAVLLAVIPSLITGEWHHWIYVAITFLVVSCPCALVLSVPLAYFCGIGAASKLGILFKSGSAIEMLNNVKTIVMDKTGTITKGDFSVQKVVPVDMDIKKLLKLAAECEMSSTHPIGMSILSAAEKENLSLKAPTDLEEIAGKGIKAEIDNQTVLCGNSSLLKEFGVNLDNYKPSKAGTEVLIAVDGKFAGEIEISDTIKPSSKSAIALMKKNGLFTAMLTGDSENNAKAVAAETGIDEVHAKLLPEQKLSELQDIRKNHGSVMFIGDGINDAPVLAGADVGAAMGSGADAAIEAADVVFMTSDVEAVNEAYNIGRKTYKIAWENVVIALGVKALIMILSVIGFANMWLAVLADTGVAMLCILNSIRILYFKYDKGIPAKTAVLSN